MEEYMNQLNQVQTALQNPDCPNRSDLIKLEQDLLELIALLIEENDDVQILEDHSEIEILNEVESDEKLDQNFDDLIGKMCKAPCPKESNLCLHTAQISDVCNLGDSGLKVKIFYNHPLANFMKKCPYLEQNRCNFGDRCKFSHGEMIDFDDLYDYEIPDFENLESESLCLVKRQDLWKICRLTSICRKEKKVAARLIDTNEEIACDFDDIYPIDENDLRIDRGMAENFSESESELEIDDQTPGPSNLVDKQRAWVHDTLGTWEDHTKGIASKLMSKMGYVPGRGLGKESQGAVEPVEARLFRKGASLDNCSESSKKLSSFNLKDPLKMAKIRKKKQKLREKCENKQFLREKCKNSSGVFAFINEKLLADEQSSKSSITDEKKQNFNKLNDEKLKIDLFILQEKIKKLESTSSKNCPRTKEFDQNLNSLKIRERNLSDEMKNRSNRRNLMKF